MNLKVSILFVGVVLFGCNGLKKKSQDSISSTKDSINHFKDIDEVKKDIQIDGDSIISKKKIEQYFKAWCAYQKKFNQAFEIDSFYRKEELKFTLTKIPFDYTKDFDAVYHNYLSYSSDGLKIIDLFSNQIELSKQTNGKFGGLYTLQVKPYLILVGDKEKYILNLFSGLDLFHDSYWLNEDLVLLIGTTKNPIPNDYSRIYRLWTVDLKNRIYTVYENKSIGKNLDIDSYIFMSIFRLTCFKNERP